MIVLAWAADLLLLALGIALVVWDVTAPAPVAPRRVRRRRVQYLDMTEVVDGITYPSRSLARTLGVEHRRRAS